MNPSGLNICDSPAGARLGSLYLTYIPIGSILFLPILPTFSWATPITGLGSPCPGTSCPRRDGLAFTPIHVLQAVWMVTWVAVVILSVDLGLAIGVVFSMMTVVCRTQRWEDR